MGTPLLGVAGGFDAASKVPYSFWTSGFVIVAYVMFGLSLGCFMCAIREVPIPYPISRGRAEPVAPAAETSTTGPPALPAAPVLIRLLVERDMTTDGFRLVALNRGGLGRFRAEVTGIRDQDGQAPVTAGSGWPVPWLDDGSVTSKDIPTAGNPRQDFAYFNLANLREDLEGTKWTNGDHWTFPSLPSPIKIRYPAVRTWQEQDRHFFIVTVRVIRDDPAGFADTGFKIGTDGQEPYCRQYTAESTAPEKSATNELVPGPAVTNRWRSTTEFTNSDLMQLQHNSMSHPAYLSRPPQDAAPASLRVGIVIACDQLPRDTPTTSTIRATFLAFLGKPDIMDLVAELTDVTNETWKARDERPRFNFGAVLAGDDENEVPAAWARLLLPESWSSHFGRDPRYADLVLYVEPGMGQASKVSAAGLAAWHQRFTRTVRLPAALARYLTSDLGLATSSDPATQIAIWLRARGTSLTELVDVDGFTIVPGSQPNWFTGLAMADQDGQDANALARTWVGEVCDSMHLDGHESTLLSLGPPTRHEGSSNGQPAQASGSTQIPHARPDVIPPPAAGAEMAYDIRLNPVKEILVRYIYQTADISMISSQSGLDQGSIAAGGAAVNYWQVVLERACLEGLPKVDAVLDRAIQHLKSTVAEVPLRAAVERYRQARG